MLTSRAGTRVMPSGNSGATIGLAEFPEHLEAGNDVVAEESTRCFDNQFLLIAPKFAAHGVDLWVPELGGTLDAHNPSYKMRMSALG